jgi:hypothetical protein
LSLSTVGIRVGWQEHFTLECTQPAVAEDESCKKAEAADPVGRRCRPTRQGEAAGRPVNTGEREVL